MKTFLALNDRQFVASEKDLWTKLHEISEGKLKLEGIVVWVKENMR